MIGGSVACRRPRMNQSPIRSREHLLHMLAEAAELEHNLLCSYLYAAFGLKRGVDEDLQPHELAAVQRWRAAIMGVCMEEMAHLAQVANLMVAVGSRPHFDRPNLPVAPGYHPARIQVALAPFDLDTLRHFIFLERPEASPVQDSAAFAASEAVERHPETGVLMPSAPDYATIGEFYELLATGLACLAGEIGESALFIGPAGNQMRAEDFGMEQLSVVTDLASAQQALQLIVEQGEGARSDAERSHFHVFCDIEREYRRLLDARPAFQPSRNVARNPVMRRPVATDRVHVNAGPAAALLDAANAVYSLMLRCLAAAYDCDGQQRERRKALVACATGLMGVLVRLSDRLTQLPANAAGEVGAGVTFAMLRATEGLAPGVDVGLVLGPRFRRIAARIGELDLPTEARAAILAQLEALRESLD